MNREPIPARTARTTVGLGALILVAFGSAFAAEPIRFNAVGPPLGGVREKIADPDWLVAWLIQPSRLRPGTAMPDFGMTEEEAQAIARFLYGEPGATPQGTRAQRGDPQLGKKLFVTRGCRGCHAVQRGEPSVSPRVPNLSDIGLKARESWLRDWVRDPRAYDPQTAMPQLSLDGDDIEHLIAFLLTLQEGSEIVASAPAYDPNAPAPRGAALIEQYECPTCHLLEGFRPPDPGFDLSTDGSPEAVLHNGRALIEQYNCRGCHVIEGRGGEIARHLDRQTFAPPTLEGEGARVQTSWLERFLRQPFALRPWLEMRMPTYGLPESEARAFAAYFAALAAVPARDEPHSPGSGQVIARGLRRVAHFKCAQCHPSTAEPPEGVDLEDLSINLLLAKGRLRPSWIRDFLARPKAILGSQTRMPSVFYTVDGVPKVEHPEEDIDSITTYLLHMEQPLDVSLRALEEQRRAAEQKEQIDWTNYSY